MHAVHLCHLTQPSASADEAATNKFASSLSHTTLSLSRVATLLQEPKFAKYGLWLLRKANLSLKSLQNISGNLTQILEMPNHPARFHAAELLLKVQDNDLAASGGALEGLPQFEEALEKAIIDPISLNLEERHGEFTEEVRCPENFGLEGDKFRSCPLRSFSAMKSTACLAE